MINVFVITLVYKSQYNHFTNYASNPSPNISSFYYEDNTSIPLTNGGGGKSSSSILSKRSKGFGNFGKFGFVPMMQNCSKCQLNDNCSNFDYNKSDTNTMNVCQSCDMNQGKNYPYYVSAKSAGRPRQCRRILDA